MASCEGAAQEGSAGRVKRQTPSVVERQGRQKEVARLDAAACIALDKKSSWRMAWALKAYQAGLAKTDLAFGKFITGKRSEEHTSELQSLMRISYAVFCLKKKKNQKHDLHHNESHTTYTMNKHIRHR